MLGNPTDGLKKFTVTFHIREAMESSTEKFINFNFCNTVSQLIQLSISIPPKGKNCRVRSRAKKFQGRAKLASRSPGRSDGLGDLNEGHARHLCRRVPRSTPLRRRGSPRVSQLRRWMRQCVREVNEINGINGVRRNAR